MSEPSNLYVIPCARRGDLLKARRVLDHRKHPAKLAAIEREIERRERERERGEWRAAA